MFWQVVSKVLVVFGYFSEVECGQKEVLSEIFVLVVDVFDVFILMIMCEVGDCIFVFEGIQVFLDVVLDDFVVLVELQFLLY